MGRLFYQRADLAAIKGGDSGACNPCSKPLSRLAPLTVSTVRNSIGCSGATRNRPISFSEYIGAFRIVSFAVLDGAGAIACSHRATAFHTASRHEGSTPFKAGCELWHGVSSLPAIRS